MILSEIKRLSVLKMQHVERRLNPYCDMRAGVDGTQWKRFCL